MPNDKKEITYEIFCIYCGIWFNDDKMICPNCWNVKVARAAKRERTMKNWDDLLDVLSELHHK